MALWKYESVKKKPQSHQDTKKKVLLNVQEYS